MGLYKKGGPNWYAAFSADGRHFNRSTTTANKRLAQKILDSWRADIIEGRFNLLAQGGATEHACHLPVLRGVMLISTQRAFS